MTDCICYGGKGGVGKTTCAAATGLSLAAAGQRMLVVSTDPAHSLEADIGPEPTELEPVTLAAFQARLERACERLTDPERTGFGSS